ncbi:MbtH family protein [Actinosynnema sp. CS-041913]|uniref:MbtH family protein n=1 Tax=Actinosynnema sp. CS-041913 TaxID=3239917 RepID=UPI003D8AC888
MSTNPFDDETASFHVLVNDEGQYSLWPSRVPVPAGWAVVLRDRPRAECVSHVDAEWTDMRPRSLVEAMRAADGERP